MQQVYFYEKENEEKLLYVVIHSFLIEMFLG